MRKIFKIAVLSGKGGVGKSMIASSLAILFSKKFKVIALDCDVDAPNLAVWLNEIGDWQKKIPVSASLLPEIDYGKCTGCGACSKICKFGAMEMKRQKTARNDVRLLPKVNRFLCEGCGACEIVCPQNAIKLKPVQNGEIRIKKTRYDFPLVSGSLFPGQTGSGKIVSELKEEAEGLLKKKNIIGKIIQISDCAPGTGCPVNACLKDADFVLLVTEPSLSGFSDLKKVLEVVKYFNVPYAAVLNKWDVNEDISRKIEKWAGKRFLGKISYDKKIFKAVSSLTPIMETSLKAKEEIKSIYLKLIAYLKI